MARLLWEGVMTPEATAFLEATGLPYRVDGSTLHLSSATRFRGERMELPIQPGTRIDRKGGEYWFTVVGPEWS